MNRHSDHWSQQAACKDYDPEIFFPVLWSAEANTPAKAICSHCPVREDCLRDAIDTGDDDFGIRGGLTAEERRKLRRRRRREPVELPTYEVVNDG